MSQSQRLQPQEWFTAAELASLALPGLPGTKRGVHLLAEREGWSDAADPAGAALARRRKGRGGGTEYHLALLPDAARGKLMTAQPAREPRAHVSRESAWARYERLPAGLRAEATERLEVLDRIESLQRGGLKRGRAIEEVVAAEVREARAAGREPAFSGSTVYAWLGRVAGVARHDWAAFLAPDYTGRTACAECPADAWAFYKGAYLHESEPTQARAYRELTRAAAKNGWPIPSAKTLQRRLDAEIPADAQAYLRKGDAAVAHHFPHLDRSRAGIEVMQIGNLDAHTWDVRVIWEDGEVGRPISLAVQDIVSSRVTSVRFDKSPNQHVVRLALADTFRDHGLFETLIMDNGRENGAKSISGGYDTLRWKAKPEDPDGLLKTLGIRPIFAGAYWGQAKPIERMFRDWAHDIARSSHFVGAYTGHNTVSKPENYGARAIPIAEFEAIVREELVHYNAQTGRTGIGKNGRSFDQIFEEGLARRTPRRATAEQLRLCLLTAQAVSMDRQSGAVRVLGNTYWSPELGARKRQKVNVRFDPENLAAQVHVYTLDGIYIAPADRIGAGSFDNVAQAQAHTRARNTYKRGVKLQAEGLRRMDAAAVSAVLRDAPPPEPPAAEPKSNVARAAFGAPRRPEGLGKASSAFTEGWERGVVGMTRR